MFTLLHSLLTHWILQIETLLCKPQSCWSLLFSWIICRWFSSKEIHKGDISYWKREIPCLMCEMHKYLPPWFFNAQEHYLIHQVEEIELCGPVHTRSMWMVERHLKSLKVFVRERACPEGSMVQGYMLYQSMVYIS